MWAGPCQRDFEFELAGEESLVAEPSPNPSNTKAEKLPAAVHTDVEVTQK